MDRKKITNPTLLAAPRLTTGVTNIDRITPRAKGSTYTGDGGVIKSLAHLSSAAIDLYKTNQDLAKTEAVDLAKLEFEKLDAAQKREAYNTDVKETFLKQGVISRAQVPAFQETLQFLSGAELGKDIELKMFERMKEVPQGGQDAINSIIDEVTSEVLGSVTADQNSPMYRGLLTAKDRAEAQFRAAGTKSILDYQEREGVRLMDAQLGSSMHNYLTAIGGEAKTAAFQDFTSSVAAIRRTQPNADVGRTIVEKASSFIESLIIAEEFDEADELLELVSEFDINQDGGKLGQVGSFIPQLTALEGRIAKAEENEALRTELKLNDQKQEGEVIASEFLAEQDILDRTDEEVDAYIEAQRANMKAGKLTPITFRAIESEVNRSRSAALRFDTDFLTDRQPEEVDKLMSRIGTLTKEEVATHPMLLPQSRRFLYERIDAKPSVDHHMQHLRPENVANQILKKQVSAGGAIDYLPIHDERVDYTTSSSFYTDFSIEEKIAMREEVASDIIQETERRIYDAAIDAQNKGEKLSSVEAARISDEVLKTKTQEFWRDVQQQLDAKTEATLQKGRDEESRLSVIREKANRQFNRAMERANELTGFNMTGGFGGTKQVDGVIAFGTPQEYMDIQMDRLNPQRAKQLMNTFASYGQMSDEDDERIAKVRKKYRTGYYEMKAYYGYSPEELATGVTSEGVAFNPSQVDPRLTPVFSSLEELEAVTRAASDGGITFTPVFYQRLAHVKEYENLTDEQLYKAQLKLLGKRPNIN